MPGAMSVPTAYMPSLSMVVFGPGGGVVAGDAAGDADAEGAGDGDADGAGEAAGDGAGEAAAGGGPGAGPVVVGSGSALATLADAAQPARTSPAAANRAAPSVNLNLIDH